MTKWISRLNLSVCTFQITLIGLVLAVAVISSDAKLFKKKKWLPSFLSKGLFAEKEPHPWTEQVKIVEIVKHVPVIQKVEVIKPIEIIKTVSIPGKFWHSSFL